MKDNHPTFRFALSLALASGLLFIFGQFPNQAEATTQTITVAILPIKGIKQADLKTVRASIQNSYGFKTVLLEPKDFPKTAWYKPRKRHRAEKILDWLQEQLPQGADHIMAVTTKDISTTAHGYEDWGICGLAEMPGTATVISTFRLRPKKKNLSKQERQHLFTKRLKDLSIHELGHNLGLPHCPQKGCFMEDAKGTVKTFDHSTGKLCNSCKTRLGI